MRLSVPRVVVSAIALVSSVGCVSYPIVKPEAFNPKPKVAIVAFQAEPVADSALGLPTKVNGIDSAYEAFKTALQRGVLFPHRLGDSSELASMVVECITNSYMNAETIRVDGGIRMPPK